MPPFIVSLIMFPLQNTLQVCVTLVVLDHMLLGGLPVYNAPWGNLQIILEAQSVLDVLQENTTTAHYINASNVTLVHSQLERPQFVHPVRLGLLQLAWVNQPAPSAHLVIR